MASPRAGQSKAAAAPNPRWGTGRQRLLTSAQALFAGRPYASVSTREIAEHAGVSEPMVFRHFGSKATLFNEAVLAPFNDFIGEFISEWEQRPRGVRDPVDEARDLYKGLYDVLTANRGLVLALIAAEANQGLTGVTGPEVPQLGAILERFEKVLAWEGQNRPFRALDPAVTSRLMFSLVLSTAIHGNWMNNGACGPGPDSEALLTEMAMMTIHGTLQRPDQVSERLATPEGTGTAQ